MFLGCSKSRDVDVLNQDRVFHRVNVPALRHRSKKLQNVNWINWEANLFPKKGVPNQDRSKKLQNVNFNKVKGV